LATWIISPKTGVFSTAQSAFTVTNGMTAAGITQ